MAKYIVVTGGAGYIGSHTVISLVENGYTPVILDDFRNANRVVVDGLKTILQAEPIIHEGDICDPNFLGSIFEKYEPLSVIHFAAYKAVGESVAEPLNYYQNNISGLVNVLQKMLEFNISNFVFLLDDDARSFFRIHLPTCPGEHGVCVCRLGSKSQYYYVSTLMKLMRLCFFCDQTVMCSCLEKYLVQIQTLIN
ncbi:MAG: GDP-mannose 4,6-dehydratase [Bacteroidota bacterium]